MKKPDKSRRNPQRRATHERRKADELRIQAAKRKDGHGQYRVLISQARAGMKRKRSLADRDVTKFRAAA